MEYKDICYMEVVEKEAMVDCDVEYKDKIVIDVSPMKLAKEKERWGIK